MSRYWSRVALCLPLAAACTTAQPTEGTATLVASPEAVQILSAAQTQFALPGRDFRALVTPEPIARRALRRWAVLPDARQTPIATTAGRIFRSDTGAGAPRGKRMNVSVGALASDGFEISDPVSGVAANVTLVDAQPARAELVDGYLVYRGALIGGGSSADVIHHIGQRSHEDFIVMKEALASASVSYQIDLDGRVAGLRLVENVLELMDATGAPRLRMKQPYLVDAQNQRVFASVSVAGCAYDSDSTPPFRRPVTAPGAATCTVTVAWDHQASLALPIILDPEWTLASDMGTAREGHILSLLSSGDVLVAGGSDGTSTLATAEVYHVASGTWAKTGSMPDGQRYGATAVLVGNQPILIGGFRGTDTITGVTAVEKYAGTWSTLTASKNARTGHTSTVFKGSSGAQQVLVVGGYEIASDSILATTERGTGVGAWSTGTIGSNAFRRTNHTATTMASGKVLVVGGYGGTAGTSGGPDYLNGVRLYNNLANSWTTPTGSGATIHTARKDHTATLLADGRVLITGGTGVGGTVLSSAEVCNSTAASWTDFGANAMSFPRTGHAVTLMADNTVLITGGIDSSGDVLASAEVYDPSDDSFSLFGDDANDQRVFHQQTLLPDDRVMLCGGLTELTTGVPTADCEFYDPTVD